MVRRRRSWYRFVFVFGLLTGLGGTLALVSAYPWVEHPRVRAHIEVQPNGGAQESFVIHLPRDRLVDSGSALALPAASPAGFDWPQALGPRGQLEQFKLRDREGEVIGIAARHVHSRDADATAAWVLYIPARGALYLRHDERSGSLEHTLQQAGLSAGTAWDGTIELARTRGSAERGEGEVIGGSGEFSRQQGSYSETWHLTGVDAGGVLRGTVVLDTRTVRAP